MQTKQAAEPISAASTDDFGCGNTGATEHPDVHVHVHAQPTISSSGDKASPSDLVLPPSEFTPSYWLLKAEPESRIEKGKDVKFSIDDLAACKEPAGWDGVRNYAARNNLRAMKKGDLAFFYHSNCKVCTQPMFLIPRKRVPTEPLPRFTYLVVQHLGINVMRAEYLHRC